jgi:hypothetical protein
VAVGGGNPGNPDLTWDIGIARPLTLPDLFVRISKISAAAAQLNGL